MSRRQTPPPDLGRDGRALWRQIGAWLSEHQLGLDPHEAPLVAELCRQVDRLAALRAALAETTPADPAWTRMATEERLGRVAYGRLVAQLGLPTGMVPEMDGGKIVGLSAASRRGSKAARARWGNAGGER